MGKRAQTPRSNIEKRDEIIFGSHNIKKYDCGSRFFNTLTARKLRNLLKENLIHSLNENGDVSKAFLVYQFMKKYPSYMAFGYAYLDRPEHVIIDGIRKEAPPSSPTELMNFLLVTGGSDKVEIGPKMFCLFEEEVPF